MIGAERLSQLDHGVGNGGRHIGDEFAEALRLAHDELGVRAVRAHAILHDDLGVYREVDGQPVHDFSGIDRIYDRVLDLGLRPIVEISFMPRDLASDPDKTVFHYGAIVSPPKDWTRWEQLVGDLAAHLVERYGRDEVRTWGFEIWNEANLEVFWSGTRDEYLRLYDVSVRAVKAVDAALPVGGPASAAAAWIDELLVHVDQSSAPIDFLSTHTYGNAPLDLRPIAARHGRPDLRLWWTEWGAHATHFNRAHDSVWSAAYLARGMVSAMGRIDALAYWTISDHFEELGRAPELLHGGFGLLGIGNLRKPRWWALWMLEQLRRAAAGRSTSTATAPATWSTPSPAPIRTERWRSCVWNGTVDVTKAGGDALPRPRRRSSTSPTCRRPSTGSATAASTSSTPTSTPRGRASPTAGRGPTTPAWQTLHDEDRLADLVPPERRPAGRRQPSQLRFALPMPAVSLIELAPDLSLTVIGCSRRGRGPRTGRARRPCRAASSGTSARPRGCRRARHARASDTSSRVPNSLFACSMRLAMFTVSPIAVIVAGSPSRLPTIAVPEVDADVDVERPAVQLLEAGPSRIGAGEDRQPGPHGAPARRLAGVGRIVAEQRHHAVAHVARHDAAVSLDGAGDVAELALQHVDDVVGQHRLGERGEAADVGEHHGDGQLVADRPGALPADRAGDGGCAPLSMPRGMQPHVGELDVALVEDQPADRHVAGHDGLAGEAELRAEPELVGDGLLPGVALAHACRPSTTTIRHVEHLPRPPQAWVKGIPARSAAGRIASPGRHSTSR